MHVDGALSQGRRGLPGGSSLQQVLARHRKVRVGRRERALTLDMILNWADAHKLHTGDWPTAQSGPIRHAPGETWYKVQRALRFGRRGLPGDSTIAELLEAHRGVRNRSNLKPLSVAQILRWATRHHKLTGRWPTRDSGEVLDGDGTTWMAIQDALYLGGRGLPGGGSLAQLLADRRGVRNIQRLPELSIAKILSWADDHKDRTGDWPIRESGQIPGSSGENWGSVDHSLKSGRRGLPHGKTLARLLAESRGKRNLRDLDTLTERQILTWAESHYRRTGRWPSQTAGAIFDAPGEKWRNVDTALYKGLRGLPGGSSLAKLLAPVKNSSATPGKTMTG